MDKAILRIAAPSIISNITVPLLGLVDLALTGHLGRTSYMGAIAVGGMLFNVIYWLCGFLRMSTGGFTAQAVGREAPGEAVFILRRSLKVALAIALLLLLFQTPIFNVSLRLMSPTPEVTESVRRYFSILIWGTPAMLSVICLNGWFIGMQNARMPMVVAIVQNVVNIMVSATLVCGFGLKIEGVAIGTLTAQWCGLAIYAVALRRTKFHHTTAEAHASLPWSTFMSTNRNIFLRTLCLVAVQFAFTAYGSKQGDVMLAVNALLLQFYTVYSYFIDGFAYAGEALGGKYCGARNRTDFDRLTRHLFLWGGGCTLFFTVLYVAAGPLFLRALTDDSRVLTAAGEYLPYAMLVPICGMAAFIFDGLFIGCTATGRMLLSTATSAAVFFALAALPSLFPALPPNHLLWSGMLAFLALRGVVLALCCRNVF